MAIVMFFVLHWYLSLFFQSFFQHRYAAHRVCTMSPFWEKVFFIGSFITQGSSYISAYAYGIMHRLHHVHTDTPEDPHTPTRSSNPLSLMWDTKVNYGHVYFQTKDVDDKYKKNLPTWHAFDKFAHSWVTRVMWLLVYSSYWYAFATEWWHWVFLPLTMIIGSLQGAVVNYFAHVVGYRNFEVNNTSRNLYPFIDLFLWGEAYHNNHHKYAGRPNNAVKWFEIDPLYHCMRFMNFVGIIKLNKSFDVKANPVF